MIDVFHGAEMPRVLLADHDPDLSACLGLFEIGGAIHAQELTRVGGDEFIPAGDVAHGTGVHIVASETNRRMKDCDSRRSQLLEIARLEAARLSFPGTKLGVI